jgi:hypothetical protein
MSGNAYHPNEIKSAIYDEALPRQHDKIKAWYIALLLTLPRRRAMNIHFPNPPKKRGERDGGRVGLSLVGFQ